MKIAEYYVSLTGMFGRRVTWNRHHWFWRETCGSLETTHTHNHCWQIVHTNNSVRYFVNTAWVIFGFRHIQSKTCMYNGIESENGTHWNTPTAGLSYLHWSSLCSWKQHIKTARVRRDSTHIDDHYWHTWTENGNENSWILCVTHWYVWTTSHLKQTPLVLTGDLRVLRDDS